MKKRPLIVVEWDDCTTDHGWCKEGTIKNETAVHSYSVGWKLPNKGLNLVLTPMRNELNDCTDRQIIPKGCIRSIRRIE